MALYYVVKVGDNRFDLRQSRFKEQLAAGSEDPRDTMAVGFDKAGMQEIIAKWFQDTDVSALS